MAPVIGGFGLPGFAVVAVGAVLFGAAFWIGRKTAQMPPPSAEPSAS